MEKKKWRPNLFDIIFIAAVAVVALVVVGLMANRGGGVAGILPSGQLQTVKYTIELQSMLGDTALMIRPGDELVDRVENRTVGTVYDVEILPAVGLRSNMITGERVLSEIPGRSDARIVVTAQAAVTDNHISVDGFTVRVGARVSINGPMYHGSGFVIDIFRDLL